MLLPRLRAQDSQEIWSGTERQTDQLLTCSVDWDKCDSADEIATAADRVTVATM